MKASDLLGPMMAALLAGGCTGEDSSVITQLDAGVRDAGPSIEPIESVEPCAPGASVPEDWAPVSDAATVIVAALGIEAPALSFEGSKVYETPGDCTFHLAPGEYLVRLSSDGVERVVESLRFDDATTTIVAVAGYASREPALRAMEVDFSEPPADTWHAQFLHLAPEALDEDLRIHTFPPGTPRQVPPGTTPTLVGVVGHGEVLRTTVPARSELFAMLPASSTVGPELAALPLVPCDASRATMAHIVWCDSLLGGAPPCDRTLGSTWYLHALAGDDCIR